jgi:hypothetical protein
MLRKLVCTGVMSQWRCENRGGKSERNVGPFQKGLGEELFTLSRRRRGQIPVFRRVGSRS